MDIITERLESNVKTLSVREERHHMLLMEREIRLKHQCDNESMRIQHQQEIETKRIEFEHQLEISRLNYELNKDKYSLKFWAIIFVILVIIMSCLAPNLFNSFIFTFTKTGM